MDDDILRIIARLKRTTAVKPEMLTILNKLTAAVEEIRGQVSTLDRRLSALERASDDRPKAE